MFDRPVKGFLEYYTETVAVGKVELEEIFPTTDSGITCISSDSNKQIKLFLRNPQNYPDIGFNYYFFDPNVQTIANSIPDSVKIQKLESNSSYGLTFSKAFLETIDGTDSNSLKGTLKLYQTSTLRNFEDFGINYIANTSPVTVRNPAFQLTEPGKGNYILCFFVPVLNNTIHKDINRIIISGTTYYLSDDRSVFYTDAEKTVSSDLFTSSASTYPLSEGGLNFSEYNKPEGYRPVYYFTNQPMSEDTVLYDITLKDKTGLESTLSISNKAEVLTPVIIKSDDYSLLTDNSTIPSKEKLETATVRFEHNGLTKTGSPVTDVLVNYSVLNGTEIIDSGTKSLPCSIEVPYGQNYTITATAQKNYFLDSSENSVSGINIKHSPVYYVSNTGSDTSLGSLGKPFATIQNCIETIKSEISNYGIYTDGYTINVLSNLERTADTAPDAPFVDINYYQDFTLTIRGTDADNNPVNRTLDAKGTEADPHQVMRYVASNIVTTFTFNLENLTLTGGYTKTQNGAGLCISIGHGLVVKAYLKNVTVTNNIINAFDKYGAGILFYSGYDKKSFLTLEDCTVSDNKNMVSSGGGIYQSTNLSNNLSPLTLKGTTTVRNNTAKLYAGIYCNDLLDIQSKDVTIVNNKSTVDGSSAGVFANKQINISGATIKDNFAEQDGSVPQSSNLKLASGIKINITGPLIGSEIHVTPGDVPTAGNPVVITENYSTHNPGIDPTEYFIADSFGITYSNDKKEAAVAISSGSYEPLISQKIAFECEKDTCTQGTAESFTIKAILDKDLESEKDITNEITSWTLSLYENGDQMKSDTFTANANTITVNANVPAGNYVIDIIVNYKNRAYLGHINFDVTNP